MEKSSLEEVFELMGTKNPVAVSGSISGHGCGPELIPFGPDMIRRVEVTPNSRDNAKINWQSTREIAENLGVSRYTVLKWIRAGIFQIGLHYRNISFDKKRPTYRFNLDQINQLFEA